MLCLLYTSTARWVIQSDLQFARDEWPSRALRGSLQQDTPSRCSQRATVSHCSRGPCAATVLYRSLDRKQSLPRFHSRSTPHDLGRAPTEEWTNSPAPSAASSKLLSPSSCRGRL